MSRYEPPFVPLPQEQRHRAGCVMALTGAPGTEGLGCAVIASFAWKAGR
jgi:hypothetical protein